MEDGKVSGLVGRAVIGLRMSECEDNLGFECSDGTAWVWETYGDCCSQTWFADIVGVDSLLGATVVSVEEVDMESIGYVADSGRCKQEVDNVYGYKIKTTAGWCDVVFRNSSNGYYGGSMEEMEADAASIGQWSSIVDDFGAPPPCMEEMASWISVKERRELEQLPKVGKKIKKDGL